MELELRALRFFVAVAEELHFSRAAERLYIDQPTLSRHIRRLEANLGVELLRRTTREVALTPAGTVFLEKARCTLAAAADAVDAARQAAEGHVGVLRVGMIAHAAPELRRTAFDVYEQRCPQVVLKSTSYPYTDPSCGLVAGETDVSFGWLPIEHPAIETEVLYEEPRLFVLAAEHPLTRRNLLRLEEVENEPFFELAGMEDEPVAVAWNDFWQLQPRPDGQRRPVGAVVSNEQEWLDGLMRGRAISTTALSARNFYPWPGIAYVKAEGISPARVAVAWRTDGVTPLVANFLAVVRELKNVEPEKRSAPPDATASTALTLA
jgi:DNA-binding transcriptional LysR family regulator